MADVLIFTSYLDNSGQPKQVYSLVDYISGKKNVNCTVFAGFEDKPQYYDQLIREKVNKLIKKNVTEHPVRIINYLTRKSKALRKLFLFSGLQKQIKKSTSFHVFGISVFNFIHKNIKFNHVYLWHNTSMIQYTDDENAFVFPRFERNVLSKITFVVVHSSMVDELVKHYGSNVRIISFKLFYNDK